MSLVLFDLNCTWQVWLLSKNLVNHVEIKVLTKHLVRSGGAVCAV